MHSKSSKRAGVLGYFETFLRQFKTLTFLILLTPLTFCCLLIIAGGLTPAIFNFMAFQSISADWVIYYQVPFLAFGAALSYLVYGVSIIFIAPLMNFLMPFRIKEWRGIWYSLPAIPWYFHNAFTYIVRYSFLEFVTPTPLNILFYRMMGMKIGKGVVINSTNISDPGLIELGDYVTIGGSAHLLAHYGQKGFLVLSKTKIGNSSTIGLKASVMGGARVGEKCVLKPHSVLLPKGKIADGEML